MSNPRDVELRLVGESAKRVADAKVKYLQAITSLSQACNDYNKGRKNSPLNDLATKLDSILLESQTEQHTEPNTEDQYENLTELINKTINLIDEYKNDKKHRLSYNHSPLQAAFSDNQKKLGGIEIFELLKGIANIVCGIGLIGLSGGDLGWGLYKKGKEQCRGSSPTDGEDSVKPKAK